MPDDPGPDVPERDEPSAADTPNGYMVSLAAILIAILIVLIIFMNLWGQGATASTAIAQNPWALQSFSNPDGTTTPVLNGTNINATFTVDGKLKGYGGCNWYSGRYMVQETRIIISQLTTTSLLCRDNATMHQEERYYALAEEAAALRVSNNTLTFYGTDGKPLLTFVPSRQRS